ncbi:hypothetical protein EVAR_16398_1 [Eumeta japonica]|uniref:Uncharacterized protein n=1 Tax=Eumeta variegata TaxID=151549 RepID=A0A4C1VV81_EUMVA|nr:hypothetical protein EVAR_16398_1 [Eumeta japonica]
MQRSRALTSFKTYRPTPTIIHKPLFCWAWILFLYDVELGVYHVGAAYYAPCVSALVDNMLHLSGHAHEAIDLYPRNPHSGLPFQFLSSKSQFGWHDTLLASK